VSSAQLECQTQTCNGETPNGRSDGRGRPRQPSGALRHPPLRGGVHRESIRLAISRWDFFVSPGRHLTGSCSRLHRTTKAATIRKCGRTEAPARRSGSNGWRSIRLSRRLTGWTDSRGQWGRCCRNAPGAARSSWLSPMGDAVVIARGVTNPSFSDTVLSVSAPQRTGVVARRSADGALPLVRRTQTLPSTTRRPATPKIPLHAREFPLERVWRLVPDT